MSEKLIKEIKQKKPTLQELKIILKKYNITDPNELHELMLTHNILHYVKKDRQFRTMKKKADKNVNDAYKELSGNPFKNAIKRFKLMLKNKFSKTRKTRKNKKNKL